MRIVGINSNKKNYIVHQRLTYVCAQCVFGSYRRMDGKSFPFLWIKLSSVMDIHYSGLLSSQNYNIGYKIMYARGTRIKTKKRNLLMFQNGSTIGPARYPLFISPKTKRNSMLPRPVVSSRPGNFGHLIMNDCAWLIHLCTRDAESIAIHFLMDEMKERSEQVLQYVRQIKDILPNCLRICGTFFTQMVVVGSMKCSKGQIPLHVDSSDYVNVLVSIGDSTVKGGETIYYDGVHEKEKGNPVK